MIKSDSLVKKRRNLIFLTAGILLIFINSLFFYIKYYPVEEDIPEVTQKTFENFLLSGNIEKISVIKNESLVYTYLESNSIEAYFEEFKEEMPSDGPHFKFSVITTEKFKNDLDEILNRFELESEPEISEEYKQFPRSYFISWYFLLEIILISVIIILNFIPSFVAIKRSFFNQIFALNVLLGWTIIGWIVALIWSLKNEPSIRNTINNV